MTIAIKIIVAIMLAGAVGGGVYVVEKKQAETASEVESTVTNTETKTNESKPLSVELSLNLGAYTLISSESLINWESSKPLIADYTHRGTIGLSKGTIDVVSETSAKGSVTIDMNTIKVTSLGGGKAGKESSLESHLKNKDFFDVATYSTGTFTIDSITPAPATMSSANYIVNGKLTLKGITKPVSFPVASYEKDGKLVVDGNVAIDRTQWGITFASKSLLGAVSNNMIDDMIKLNLHLVAKKD